MIRSLDMVLRDLLESRVPELAAESRVAFESPDETWRSGVAAAGEDRLNCYLYDLREHLKPHSSDRLRGEEERVARRAPAAPAPRLLLPGDCLESRDGANSDVRAGDGRAPPPLHRA